MFSSLVRNHSLFACSLIVLIGGCGGASGTFRPLGDGGTRGDGGVIPGGSFAVTVDSAIQVRSVGSHRPAAGKVLVQLGVTLYNRTELKPLPANLLTFSLQTASNLIHMALVQSQTLMPACPTDVSVAQGGMVSCQVAFEIAASDMPAKVLYSDQMTRMTSAAVPAVMPLKAPTCADFTKAQAGACITCFQSLRQPGNSPCFMLYLELNNDCPDQIAQNCIEEGAHRCYELASDCPSKPDARCSASMDEVTACELENCSDDCL